MDTSATPVTGQAFRDVIGRFTTGVTVVTSRDDDGDHGMTASAVSSLSLEPPMLLVCVNRRSRTGDAVRASGRFTINVLAEDQASTAQRFARHGEDRFADVATTRGPLGTLLLGGCLAHIDCTVDDALGAATHHIIIGLVQRVDAREGRPLAYFRGQFGQLQPARDDAVTRRLRERILSQRSVALDPAALATELGTDVGRIDRALSALRADGLVAGDPVDGYRVAPVDLRAIDDAIDARLAIELGATDLAIAARDTSGMAELRRQAERTVAAFTDGRVTDVDEYTAADTAFHEQLVRLGGSAALLDSYRRLSLQGILLRAVDRGLLTSDHAEDHVEIVEAMSAGDPTRTRQALRRHSDRARATHHAAALRLRVRQGAELGQR